MTQTQLTNLKIRFIDVAIMADSTAIRFALMVSEFAWAIALLFAYIPYPGLGSLFSTDIWAILFFATGLGQMTLIITGKYNNPLSLAFATWEVLLWWFVVLYVTLSSYHPVAGGDWALAIAASWVLCKTGAHKRNNHD